jgi:hypothetical protein
MATEVLTVNFTYKVNDQKKKGLTEVPNPLERDEAWRREVLLPAVLYVITDTDPNLVFATDWGWYGRKKNLSGLEEIKDFELDAEGFPSLLSSMPSFKPYLCMTKFPDINTNDS